MRFYRRTTPDKKIELTIYPQELEDEVGTALRLTPQEAQALIILLENGLREAQTSEEE